MKTNTEKNKWRKLKPKEPMPKRGTFISDGKGTTFFRPTEKIDNSIGGLNDYAYGM